MTHPPKNHPADGAVLLDAVRAALLRYVVLPERSTPRSPWCCGSPPPTPNPRGRTRRGW